MLTKTQMIMASVIATDLVEDGLIVGEELEWYIKEAVKTKFDFKNSKQYLEFENCVLDHVDKRRYFIQVSDTYENKRYNFRTVVQAAQELDIPQTRLYSGLRRNGRVDDRYNIERIKLSIKELVVFS